MREVLRIADVNFNRAREGLRVAEEASRFALADAGSAAAIKDLRHRLSALEEAFPGGRPALLAARDIPGDAGALAPEHRPRDDVFAAAGAGWKRAQEAARVLEELSRALDPVLAHRFKELRFALYAAEREWALAAAAQGRRAAFERVGLYLVAGRADTGGRPLVEVVRAAVAGGAGAVQLREKHTQSRELTALAAELCRAVRASGALFLVNDRVDVAAAVDADGVHLGQEDMPVDAARRLLGPGKLIGATVHSPAQAREVREQGADYIGLGAVFSTATKPEAGTPGLSRLSELAAGADLPSVAIGGIDQLNVEEVLRAGFRRVAVVRAVAGAPDPRLAAAALCAVINEVWGDR